MPHCCKVPIACRYALLSELIGQMTHHLLLHPMQVVVWLMPGRRLGRSHEVESPPRDQMWRTAACSPPSCHQGRPSTPFFHCIPYAWTIFQTSQHLRQDLQPFIFSHIPTLIMSTVLPLNHLATRLFVHQMPNKCFYSTNRTMNGNCMIRISAQNARESFLI